MRIDNFSCLPTGTKSFSLEELGSLSGVLELRDESGHKPVIIGGLSEVHVALTLDVDNLGGGGDEGDVVLSLAAWTHIVSRADKEAHWHVLDLGNIDQVSLLSAVEPLVLELLEAILEPVHDPVLLRLH